MVSWIPITTQTEWPWLERVARMPLLGALVALFLTAWPATAYINVAERISHTTDAPGHTLVGFVLAGTWSALLWKKYRTKVSVFWLPTPLLWPAIGLLMFFHHPG